MCLVCVLQALLRVVRERGAAVPEVAWAKAGEDAGLAALMGQPDSFLSPTRLALYGSKRNDPTIPQVRTLCVQEDRNGLMCRTLAKEQLRRCHR